MSTLPERSAILVIDPPLPCGKIIEMPHRLCGQPAKVASALWTPSGRWILLPMCKDCVDAANKVFGVGCGPGTETTDG